MKQTLKQIAFWVSFCLVLPLLASHWLQSRVTGADQSLEAHSEWLALLPGKIGSYLRVAFYRFALEHCEPSATICFGVLFSKPTARIGHNVYIGPRSMIGEVTIEDDVLIGPAVQIPSGPFTHGFERLDTPIRLQSGKRQRVVIGRDSWIGAASVVLADVGTQCVVGASSIVTKPLEACSIAVGNPARRVAWRGQSKTTHSSGSVDGS